VTVPNTVSSVSELPNRPAVYALLGGRGRTLHVAYVGIAERLKVRITQHLVTRDSSVSTRTSAVGLNPDLVSEVRWWEHAEFADRNILVAAELVAFDVLDPVLRSRGATQAAARNLYADEGFHSRMRALFESEPTGRMVVPTLQDALRMIGELDDRLTALEAKLSGH
jgi:hypothetical protein